jgi:hypothetical protein
MLPNYQLFVLVSTIASLCSDLNIGGATMAQPLGSTGSRISASFSSVKSDCVIGTSGRKCNGSVTAPCGMTQCCVGNLCIHCENDKCIFEGQSVPQKTSISCENGQCTVFGPGEKIIPADMDHPIPSDVADLGSSGSPTDEVTNLETDPTPISTPNKGCDPTSQVSGSNRSDSFSYSKGGCTIGSSGRKCNGSVTAPCGMNQCCVGNLCIHCKNGKCIFEGQSVPPKTSISCENGQCTVSGPGT